MSSQADDSPPTLVELPSTWLAHLVQHVASGPGGLASAAALSQTCKSFQALSESSAVTYRNLHVDKPLHNLAHPFFQWLAKRHGRIAGLTAELRLVTVHNPEQLQVMFGIPGLHLTVCYDAEITSPDELFMTKVLIPHGHLIDHLTSFVCTKVDGLKLQDFCEAAAPCRSLDLTAEAPSGEPVNMGDLSPVAGSLVRLNLECDAIFNRFFKLESVSSLSILSQLTSLSLEDVDFGADEPWTHVVGLTNLKQLSLWGAASGDPSPLSALTGLSSLDVLIHIAGEDGLVAPASTFSSLQPLSTLQQLQELKLYGKICSATSLHGLAELSRLETLRLDAPMLKSLEGISTGLTSLNLDRAPELVSLAGIEHLQGLQKLTLRESGLTSLHPLAALVSLEGLRIGGTFTSLAGLEGNLCTCVHRLTLESCQQLRQLSGIEGLTALQRLEVIDCGVTSLRPVGQLVGGLNFLKVRYCDSVQEEVLELPHILPTADVRIEGSTVKEVVLAGGLRRRPSM